MSLMQQQPMMPLNDVTGNGTTLFDGDAIGNDTIASSPFVGGDGENDTVASFFVGGSDVITNVSLADHIMGHHHPDDVIGNGGHHLMLTEEEFFRLNSTHRQSICTEWYKDSVTELLVTDFRMNPYYISIYVNYVNLIFNLIVPTLVLGILNCFIYRALRNNSVLANQLRRTGGGAEALRKRDVRLTRIAIVIVGIFITCHLPRFIPNITELFVEELPEWSAIIISFTNLLQIINCTVNYLIYFGHCWKRSDESSNRDDMEMESKAANGALTLNGTSSNHHNSIRTSNTIIKYL